MSDFEIRANNIATSIGAARQRVMDFGYDDDPVDETISRVAGMFITWLTSCEEARHQGIDPRATFTKNVIGMLPEGDDASWGEYISPPPTSTLKQRVQALWGIRVAYTHGDGDVTLVTNATNTQYILDAPSIFRGVYIDEDNKLILKGFSFHQAIRTMVQVRDVLP